MKKLIASIGLSLCVLGGAVACERRPTVSDRIEGAGAELSDQLDNLENDWIRLKGKAEGKSELEQELSVLRDEIDEEVRDLRGSLEKLKSSAGKESKEVERDLEKGISELERKIQKAKRDLG